MDIADIRFALKEIDAFVWPTEDAKLRNKRQRILEAATHLFVRSGYRKTSIDEIAQRAAVAKGTVYLYYRNKAELVYHALALEERKYLERLIPTAEHELDPSDRLREIIRLIIVISHEMPLYTSLVTGDHEIEVALRELQETDRSVFAEIIKVQRDFIIQVLDLATGGKLSSDELQKRGQILVDLLYGVITFSHTNQNDLPWEEYASAMADILIDGALGHCTQDTSCPKKEMDEPLDDTKSVKGQKAPKS